MAPTDQLFGLITNQTTQSLMNIISTLATVASTLQQNGGTSHQDIYHIYQPAVHTTKETSTSFLFILFYLFFIATSILLLTHNLQSISSSPLTLTLCIVSLILFISIYVYRYFLLRLLLILTIIITFTFANSYIISHIAQTFTAILTSETSIDTSPTQQAKEVIKQFYQDINKRDYQAAYDLTANGFSESYSQFAKGFRYTEHDDISFDCIKQLSDGTVQVTITIKATEDPPAGKHISTYYAQYIIGLDHGAYIILRGNLLPTHSTCSNNSK